METIDTNIGLGPATEMTATLAERLRNSGVFDPAYYLSAYREDIPPGKDPLEHFVSDGLARGFRPNKRIDPLVQRIAHPELDNAAAMGRILDGADRDRENPSLQSALSAVEKTTTFLPTKDFEIGLVETMSSSLAAADRMADARVTAFTVANRTYRLVVPPAEDLLNRLREDRPFAFARLSHGDWDDLYVFQRYRGRVARATTKACFSKEEIDRLTMRLCDLFYPDEGMFVENFMQEFLSDLGNRALDENLMLSVCFKGYPTADEELFYRTRILKPVDTARLDIFARYFGPDETIYDANLFKRWSISGPLRYLPELARERPVIFMGADRLKSLRKRWRLPWMLHIPIHPDNSYPLRHGLLEQAREKIAEANEIARTHNTKRPLFLLQGSSFAYWFMVRLWRDHPDIFYLDLGQSLHIWFYDREDIPFMPERELYGRIIIRNCGLEEYYRNLGTLLTPELSPPSASGT